jgi:hypothetical protein
MKRNMAGCFHAEASLVLRWIVRRASRIWETPVKRIAGLALTLLLTVSALPTQAAIIDFTTGTFECTTGTLDPITNYRDQGVVISNYFFVFRGGDNVTCPEGYPPRVPSGLAVAVWDHLLCRLCVHLGHFRDRAYRGLRSA